MLFWILRKTALIFSILSCWSIYAFVLLVRNKNYFSFVYNSFYWINQNIFFDFFVFLEQNKKLLFFCFKPFLFFHFSITKLNLIRPWTTPPQKKRKQQWFIQNFERAFLFFINWLNKKTTRRKGASKKACNNQ